MASGPITSWQNRWGNNGNSDKSLFSWAPKSLQTVTAAMNLKDTCFLEEKQWQTFVVVQPLSHCCLFATPWSRAFQASLYFTISWSLLKLMSIESVMPSNHLVFCCPLFLLPSIFPSIRVFSNESALHIRCPKYWSFPLQWILRIDFL